MASATCGRSPEPSSLIISHLAPKPLITSQDAPESLAVYATISQEWRRAVKRRTFSKLHLTSSRLADSACIVTGPRRRLVRCIKFDIVLDAYGNEACSEYETPEEQKKNNSDFTEAVNALFSHLSTWPEEQVSKSGIELSIMAYSPSDLFRLPDGRVVAGCGCEPLYLMVAERSHLSARSRPSPSQTQSTPKLAPASSLRHRKVLCLAYVGRPSSSFALTPREDYYR
jgi:hypothetical protein